MLKSESVNSLVSLGSSEKHMRVVERLLNNDMPEEENTIHRQKASSQISEYSDSSVESKLDIKSISSKKSSVRSVKSAELTRIKNLSKLSKKSIRSSSKNSKLDDNNENEDQHNSLILLEEAIYNKENVSRKSSLKKSIKRSESQISESADSSKHRPKTRRGRTDSSLQNVNNLERDEVIIISRDNLRLLKRSKLNKTNEIAEFKDNDIDAVDNQKLKFRPSVLNAAPLLNDLNPRYENTKTEVIRPPPPKPKPQPPEKPKIRQTLKFKDMSAKIKDDLEERKMYEKYEKLLKETQESKSFSEELRRFIRLPNRLRLIKSANENKLTRSDDEMETIFKRLSTNEFNSSADSDVRPTLKSKYMSAKIKDDLEERKMFEEYEKSLKEIQESKYLTKEEVERSVLRLSRLPNRLRLKKSVNENQSARKFRSDEEMEIIFKRLSTKQSIGPADSNRTIKENENKSSRKFRSDEEMEIIFKRLSTQQSTGPADSNRTIKSSPHKNSDLVNSHAWKGYN